MEKFILKSQRNITILDDKELKNIIGGSGKKYPVAPDPRRMKFG
ncbi:bacteriocin [Streptococcus suis]|uniref:Bacteriocin n=1 Tax=Streptococcus suis TaxID=1307 RepID=A0A116P8M9_STRSU|nr:bacteriocin [Streptococcus suis]NQG29541.1 bacteriocin [Streptococcus suis]CYW44351.1 Uncharacterised protein [Streptococcus suis]HEM5998469.1 bacteriocin [Streptococcus suis]